ncbi:MAG: TonB-dependent receptor, partial [Planctomycetales bacterium]|nr:TonB-dependent receptor [Planctomycetales bacterium]
SGEYSTYDGDYVYVRTGQALPPKPPREKFAVPWAEVKRRSINTGLLIDADPAPDWTLTATAFYADTKRSPVDFTSAALTNARTAQITWIHTDVLHGRTATGELATERRFTTGTADHALIAAVRGRHSRQLNISRAPVFVGTVDVDDPVFPLQPALPPALGELHSDVDQGIFSLGYRGDYFGRLEFKVGLHRSVYTKKVSPPGGAKTSRTTRKWLYDASLVLAATGKTTLFANAVRGIEESGTAPQNAVNRFAVLPPVIAREYEIGMRQELTDTLVLTLSGFDTTKLTAALDPNGIYALVGKVRHRGGELSLTGRIAANTSVVIGGMAMKPKLSGQLVDAGLVSARPVGVSSSLGFAGIDQTFDWAPNWAFDARGTWQAGRAADSTNT